MNPIPHYWRGVLLLLGLLCLVVALVLAAAPNNDPDVSSAIPALLLFAVLLIVAPRLDLSRLTVRKIAALVLAVVLAGFAYLFISLPIDYSNDEELGPVGRIVLVAFLALLILGLLGEALGLLRHKPVENDNSSGEDAK